jgi:acetolactate synthase-1/2/3 large subunit
VNGAELLVQELSARGVEFISTLCSHGLNPLYVACQARGIRLIDTRNEQAAAYLAEACGRLSRRVGVCAVNCGQTPLWTAAASITAFLSPPSLRVERKRR